MRVAAVLVLGAAMYVAVPMLWQLAMVTKVNEMAESTPPMVVDNTPIATVDPDIINAINPPLDFNVEEAEAFGTQAAADRTMRDISAAQDAAAKVRYP